jgi:hypothetical protein
MRDNRCLAVKEVQDSQVETAGFAAQFMDALSENVGVRTPKFMA